MRIRRYNSTHSSCQRQRGVISASHPDRFTTYERSPGTTEWDDLEKKILCPCWEPNHDSSVAQPLTLVTILTELTRVLKPRMRFSNECHNLVL